MCVWRSGRKRPRLWSWLSILRRPWWPGLARRWLEGGRGVAVVGYGRGCRFQLYQEKRTEVVGAEIRLEGGLVCPLRGSLRVEAKASGNLSDMGGERERGGQGERGGGARGERGRERSSLGAGERMRLPAGTVCGGGYLTLVRLAKADEQCRCRRVVAPAMSSLLLAGNLCAAC